MATDPRKVGEMEEVKLSEARRKELQPLVEKVVQFVTGRGGGVTFVELESCLAYDIPVGGHYGIHMPGAPNIVLWMGVSQEFTEVFAAIHDAGVLDIHSTHFLTYMVDGKALQLPLAKARTIKQAKAYKTLHWAPVTFSVKKQSA